MFSRPSSRKNRKIVVILICFLGLLFAGCTPSEIGVVPSPTLEGKLIPYLTATHHQVPVKGTATRTPSQVETNIPSLTSTPFIYEVVENDTLTGIAIQHSISLEDLITANPSIDPNFLTIGLTLTIPLEGGVISTIPTSTPIPIILQSPVCYPLIDGSLQCMSTIENDQPYPVENVIALISLQSPGVEDPISKIAITPINIIPAGKKAAVAASFEPPLLTDYVAYASLMSVIPVAPTDQRYLRTEFHLLGLEISSNGKQARVTGEIENLPEQTDATEVWASAFAYDENNEIVGIRKWVADENLTSGDRIKFNLIVYSLGTPIDRVDILVEARP